MDSEKENKMSKCIGFTGTRKGMSEKQKFVFQELWKILVDLYEITSVRHGDCVGADAEFHSYVKSNTQVKTIIHPPTNDTLRAWCEGDVINQTKDYLERNRDIVDNSDIVIACPPSGSTGGTWSTIRYASKKSVPVILIFEDGSREMRNFS